ncbi:peptide/nickel transport system ATP-binding protein [Nocardioides daedukensis]|uniref:Peptide/nickel transport system ATP-binding protein n=1 Tax=Nocardioides daedukensis TaxID=634462 RepID=A0A7Y9RW01_9ACTN|nr:ABC transporter ATP-binding protein [Nocardioides daedukensis]NYG57667.1 peptide/nickel transport system ATP-binding protein [Nocardioides daedukensis]
MSRTHDDQPLLAVRNLSVTFSSRGTRPVRAVDEVSFEIRPGQHLGLVGESGSGKSVTSLAIMGLLPARSSKVEGEVLYAGRDLLSLGSKEMAGLRGKDIAMVFQDPMTSLNPVVKIGLQLTEVLRRHLGLDKKAATLRAIDLLEMVGIPDPARRVGEYPHQLSGGMRQRVLIAIALACEPKLLIADEPTTALDVTIQAQVLEVLKDLVADTNAALLMITHDLGVVAGLCDEVNVMYSGRIVESAARHELFATPRHPYTGGLLESIPRLDAGKGAPLRPIPGSPTQTLPWTQGCAFAPRCQNADETCRTVPPKLEPTGDRDLRCHHPLEAVRRDEVTA